MIGEEEDRRESTKTLISAKVWRKKTEISYERERRRQKGEYKDCNIRGKGRMKTEIWYLMKGEEKDRKEIKIRNSLWKARKKKKERL
jgi:hypothetical protein